ncbi:MAG TPA: hypothetical protein PLU30_06925 [Verrucomicrobiae bacterium]|nr:hypothetical protein [Verrucomicrobiae bacterium]
MRNPITLKRILFVLPATVVYALPVLFAAGTVACKKICGQGIPIDPESVTNIFRLFFLCQVWMAIYCIIHVRSETLLVRIALVTFAIEALLTAIGMTKPTPFTPCENPFLW